MTDFAAYLAFGAPDARIVEARRLFRTGPRPRSDGMPPSSSHSYFAVPPEAGTLWLFPGSIPHCVMGMVPARPGVDICAMAESGRWTPRISVGINYVHSV